MAVRASAMQGSSSVFAARAIEPKLPPPHGPMAICSEPGYVPPRPGVRRPLCISVHSSVSVGTDSLSVLQRGQTLDASPLRVTTLP